MFSSSSQAFLDFGKYIGGCLWGLKSFFRKEFLRFKAETKKFARRGVRESGAPIDGAVGKF